MQNFQLSIINSQLKYVPLTVGQGRLHLRKTQINLVFRSICTTFAPQIVNCKLSNSKLR